MKKLIKRTSVSLVLCLGIFSLTLSSVSAKTLISSIPMTKNTNQNSNCYTNGFNNQTLNNIINNFLKNCGVNYNPPSNNGNWNWGNNGNNGSGNNNGNNTDNGSNNNENNENTATEVSDIEKEVARLVNIERQKYGLKDLTLDAPLSAAARLKSQDMVDKNYFSHQSPTYGSPFDMLRKLNISYQTAGENIAMGQRTATEVVNAWMNSSGHRANILSQNYGKIGVGYATKNGTPYWTQIFTN